MELYDSSFKCSYKEDGKNDDDYRSDFLRAFKLNSWEGEKIDTACTVLWKKLSEDSNFCGLIVKSLFYNADDLVTSLMGLFNYDQFDIIHECISEIINDGQLSDTTYKSALDRME